MTIKTFWTIFIKILGLWLVLDCFTVIPQFFSTLFLIKNENGLSETTLTFLLLLLTLGIYAFILHLFVFKTNWLIEKLHLEKGFTEEKIDLNISANTIIQIATIVIGGFLLIDSIPSFCKQIFAFYQQKSIFREFPSSNYIIFYFIKLVIGYLLLTNSKIITEYINKKEIINE